MLAHGIKLNSCKVWPFCRSGKKFFPDIAEKSQVFFVIIDSFIPPVAILYWVSNGLAAGLLVLLFSDSINAHSD